MSYRDAHNAKWRLAQFYRNLFVLMKFYIHIYQYDPCVFSCNVICNFATAYLTTKAKGVKLGAKANTHVT